MCFWWFCLPSSSNNKKNDSKGKVNNATATNASSTVDGAVVVTSAVLLQEQKDYEDLQHMARKREIKVTIRKGTQAGVAAGLSVMAGVIVAGPVGAVVGGAVGTAMAARISRNVVSLNELLEKTPVAKRREVLTAFHQSFKEEFMDTIANNPELKLLMGGTSIFGVMRYMVDRELLKNDQMEKLDRVLRRVV
jgi:adenylosuccinate synthase